MALPPFRVLPMVAPGPEARIGSSSDRLAAFPPGSRISTEGLPSGVDERAALVFEELDRVHRQHYQSAGEAEVNRRLEALFDRLVDGIAG
jgi:hypothetical protein